MSLVSSGPGIGFRSARQQDRRHRDQAKTHIGHEGEAVAPEGVIHEAGNQDAAGGAHGLKKRQGAHDNAKRGQTEKMAHYQGQQHDDSAHGKTEKEHIDPHPGEALCIEQDKNSQGLEAEADQGRVVEGHNFGEAAE